MIYKIFSLLLFLFIVFICCFEFEYYESSLLVLLVIYSCFLIMVLKKFSAYSYECFFTIFTSIYIVSGLIDYVLFGNTLLVTKGYILYITMFGTIFLLTYLFILFIFVNSQATVYARNLSTPRSRKFYDTVCRVTMISSLFLLALYLLFTLKLFSGGSSILSRADIYKSKSVLIDLLKLFIPVFILIFYTTISKYHYRQIRKRIFIFYLILTSFLSVEIFVYGDRRTVLTIILSMLIIKYHGQKMGVLKPLSLIFIAFVFTLYGFLRNRSFSGMIDIFSHLNYFKLLNPVNSEFGYFHKVGYTLYNVGIENIHDFTIFKIIPSLIPRFFYPDRLLPPPVLYVKMYYPDVYESGGGFAYNIIFESIQNFYMLGPVLLAIVLSLFNVFVLRSKLSVRPYLYVVLMYCGFFVMRFDSVTFFRTFIAAIIIVFFVLISSSIFMNIKGS